VPYHPHFQRCRELTAKQSIVCSYIVSLSIHNTRFFSRRRLHSLPMYSLNRVSIIGYQTQPVQVRQTPGGTSVTDLNVVVPATIRMENGTHVQSRSFHTVTVWGPMADVAGQFLKPGGHVFLSGRLQTDSWEDEQSHEKRSKTKIVAQEMILLDPKDGQMSPPPSAKGTLGAVNRADVLGNVTRDPELRTTTSGQQVLTLGVATNERWKDRTSGEPRDRTEFHNIVIWGELANEVSTTIRKGNRVFVSGRIQTRSWETQSGSKRTTTEVVAETVLLLGVKNAVAAESVRIDSPVQREAREAAPVQEGGAEPVLAGIPDVRYESDIKVEDLPF